MGTQKFVAATIRQLYAGQPGWAVDLNLVAAGVGGGTVGGLVAGGLARVAMRVVALLAGQRPEFHLLATIAIMLLFALAGVLFALLYLALRPLLPINRRWKGVLFGALLAGLTVLPFLGDGEGEVSLVAPLTGALLFVPIPLIYGLVLDAILCRHERHRPAAQPVAWSWFAGFLLAFGFALVRMVSALDTHVRTPAAIRQVYAGLGIAADAVQEIHGLLGFTFALVYSGCVRRFSGVGILTLW